MTDYLVIFEQGQDGGWGAFAPDLPGLVAAAETQAEVALLMHDGIKIYLDELREDGLPIPQPTTVASRIAVAA